MYEYKRQDAIRIRSLEENEEEDEMVEAKKGQMATKIFRKAEYETIWNYTESKYQSEPRLISKFGMRACAM